VSRRHAPGAGAFREAVTLPMIFLTVTLAGGFRMMPGPAGLRFLPPPLVALVLAMLVLAVLIRSGTLVGSRLMGQDRDALGNLSGAVVLVTLFTATAQLFNSITPETGLLHLIFNVFFFLLLWNTLAAGPDTPRLLHSLMVVFGSAFAVKYIILAALYDPQGGLTKRVLTTLLEGVTLGTIEYQVDAPLTGYVGFFTVVLYLVGLFLLPGRSAHMTAHENQPHEMARTTRVAEPFTLEPEHVEIDRRR
jgi:hypothetical protein